MDLNEKQIKIRSKSIPIEISEEINPDQDYKITILVESGDEIKKSNKDGTFNLIYNLSILSIDELKEVNTSKVIKTKEKLSKSQLLRLVLEDIASIKGLKDEQVENFYSKWYENKIEEAKNYRDKLINQQNKI